MVMIVVVLYCIVFWGGREGFQSLLNTDVLAELTHAANFFKMAVGKKHFYMWIY